MQPESSHRPGPQLHMLPALQSQLRAQLLSQLQKHGQLTLQPPQGDAPGLKRRALNSLINEYLAAAHYDFSLRCRM